jgi:ADP-dependent NAD(P)H-hydrate dehydratase / NAD(P)H-hydrate epimerase
MKIVSAAEMREIDRLTSEKFDVPSLTLMENAGSAVAQFVLTEYPQAKRVAVVCGKGNNGGDGFVVARKLREAEKEVRVLLMTDPAELRGDAAQMFRRMGFMPVVAATPEQLDSDIAQGALEVDLIVDAVLGTGFRPPVAGLLADAIERINAQALPVIAVDIPSGADADAFRVQDGPVARANAILTFTAARPAHVFSPLTSGPTVIAPIGSPSEAILSSLKLNLIIPKEIAALIGPRPAEANKGSYGHVLVIGGSLGKAGAAAMAGMSALRVGAGLSTVATAKSVLATVAGFHPELMTEPLQETDAGTISLRALEYGHLDELTKGKTVLAIGPGISRNQETSEFVRTIVERYRVPMVLDADGLNAFEGVADKLNGGGHPLVITPHPGEMARLTGLSIPDVQKDRIGVARGFAKDHDIIVVLKGHRTLIAQPDGEVWVNTTGNPGMATGGTGDILTGMVAGMVAQNPKRVVEAVCTAVYLHGLAGDVACETMGEPSLVATDLIGALPEAMRRIRSAARLSEVRFHGSAS